MSASELESARKKAYRSISPLDLPRLFFPTPADPTRALDTMQVGTAAGTPKEWFRNAL